MGFAVFFDELLLKFIVVLDPPNLFAHKDKETPMVNRTGFFDLRTISTLGIKAKQNCCYFFQETLYFIAWKAL